MYIPIINYLKLLSLGQSCLTPLYFQVPVLNIQVPPSRGSRSPQAYERAPQTCKGHFRPDQQNCCNNNNNNSNNNNNNNNNNNDDDNYYYYYQNEEILLVPMLTIKILFTINSLEERKNYSFKTLLTMLTIKILFTINSLEERIKLFIQNTIYNSCRFKKHLMQLRKS